MTNLGCLLILSMYPIDLCKIYNILPFLAPAQHAPVNCHFKFGQSIEYWMPTTLLVYLRSVVTHSTLFVPLSKFVHSSICWLVAPMWIFLFFKNEKIPISEYWWCEMCDDRLYMFTFKPLSTSTISPCPKHVSWPTTYIKPIGMNITQINRQYCIRQKLASGSFGKALSNITPLQVLMNT